MKYLLHSLKTVSLLAFIVSCSNKSITSQTEDLNELNNLKTEIDQLVATGVCEDNSTCDYIAFGSKACGGPINYLVYSTSINVDLLKQKVTTYNQLQSEYNKKWNVFSDCMAVMPPTSITCVDGKCTAVD